MSKMTPSVSGQGGHDRLYAAAMACRAKFGLDAEQIREVLEDEFNPRCGPPWHPREIAHKINQAMKNGVPEKSGSSFPAVRLKPVFPSAITRQPSVPPAPPGLGQDRPSGKKTWTSKDEALAAFEKMPPARDDPDAQRLFQEDYGLAREEIPSDWRIHAYGGRNGVVYPGMDTNGQLVALKWKSLARDTRGKRASAFLFGRGGVIALDSPSLNAPVVIVDGEEKCAVASAAGFNALGSLTGESELEPEWVSRLCEEQRTTILANDNDEHGDRANQKTAQALELAGLPTSQTRIVNWPANAAQGYDLNDLAKESGLSAVGVFLESAPCYEGILPRVLPVTAFVATERPPLRFHIEKLLPEGGKMTFSAPSKFGKSMWAIQTGLVLSAGCCEWLGFEFGSPARVLYIQAEIMDTLLAARLSSILGQIPLGIDRGRAEANFLVQEISTRRPNLYSDEGRAIAEALIRTHRPRVIILDPLAALCPGMEENAAESMSAVLDYFSNLTVRFGCAVILIHHHGKAGYSRGSSVFEGWPESDLQVSPDLVGQPSD